MEIIFIRVYFLIGVCATQAQQQYLRVIPKDVTVNEGETAILECEVGNLAGQVQWTKNGFALGFSSVIPGQPRYSMIVDRSKGKFNLEIVNATLEDEAEYQCQVLPANNQKAIRAKANLFVIPITRKRKRPLVQAEMVEKQDISRIQKVIQEDLEEKKDLSKIFIISASIAGILLFLHIIVLGGCMLGRRAVKIRERNNRSSESDAVEMNKLNNCIDIETKETVNLLSSASDRNETSSNEEESRKPQASNSSKGDQPNSSGAQPNMSEIQPNSSETQPSSSGTNSISEKQESKKTGFDMAHTTDIVTRLHTNDVLDRELSRYLTEQITADFISEQKMEISKPITTNTRKTLYPIAEEVSNHDRMKDGSTHSTSVSCYRPPYYQGAHKVCPRQFGSNAGHIVHTLASPEPTADFNIGHILNNQTRPKPISGSSNTGDIMNNNQTGPRPITGSNTDHMIHNQTDHMMHTLARPKPITGSSNTGEMMNNNQTRPKPMIESNTGQMTHTLARPKLIIGSSNTGDIKNNNQTRPKPMIESNAGHMTHTLARPKPIIGSSNTGDMIHNQIRPRPITGSNTDHMTHSLADSQLRPMKNNHEARSDQSDMSSLPANGAYYNLSDQNLNPASLESQSPVPAGPPHVDHNNMPTSLPPVRSFLHKQNAQSHVPKRELTCFLNGDDDGLIV